jgi:hypothetical protein
MSLQGSAEPHIRRQGRPEPEVANSGRGRTRASRPHARWHPRCGREGTQIHSSDALGRCAQATYHGDASRTTPCTSTPKATSNSVPFRRLILRKKTRGPGSVGTAISDPSRGRADDHAQLYPSSSSKGRMENGVPAGTETRIRKSSTAHRPESRSNGERLPVKLATPRPLIQSEELIGPCRASMSITGRDRHSM